MDNLTYLVVSIIKWGKISWHITNDLPKEFRLSNLQFTNVTNIV